METKPLHKTGKEALPQAGEEAQKMHHSNGEKTDMSHVEKMMDSMNDEEAEHAHKHLSKRLNKGQEGGMDNTNTPEPTMDDFEAAMQG